MFKDAAANTVHYNDEREKINAINHADQLIYKTEKTLVEISDETLDSERNVLNAAIKTLREKAIVDNLEGIKTATEALVKASHRMAQEHLKKL
jgi:molecular chaperone DnaK